MRAMDASDEQLWEACLRLPTDFEPYGRREWLGRQEARPDCATCRWFAELFRAWPDWGACANPQSPRAGLLTFRGQGCWQFEPEEEEGDQGAFRARGFKNCFERILREQACSFILEQVRQATDPLPEEEAAAAGPKDIRENPLFIMLRRLLRHADEGFRRQPVDEMAARARWDSSRYWGYARRYWARTFGVDVSEIRLPPNTWELEEEFWERVDAIISEALQGQGPGPAKGSHRRAG